MKDFFSDIFDKNFKHAEEQLIKVCILINDSEDNAYLQKEFDIFFSLAKEQEKISKSGNYSPAYKELLILLLHPNSKIGQAFWYAFSKSFSQINDIQNNLSAEDLISIMQTIKEGASENLFRTFEEFVAVNGLLRSSSKKHLEYSSITQEDGQSSLRDLVFNIDNFETFINLHKNILLDGLLFSLELIHILVVHYLIILNQL